MPDYDEIMEELAQSIPAEAANDINVETPPGGMPEAVTNDIVVAADASTNTNTNDTTTKPVVDPNASQQQTAAPVVAPTFDFEGISGGIVKSPEDITRIANENKAFSEELRTLKAQAAVDPYANSFIKDLNQMHKDGKSEAQIKAFIQLQDLGDISQLSPMDAMIQAKLLRDGRNPEIAKLQLEKKYGITADMDEVDRSIAEADMADDAKGDYEYLKAHKKELATPVEAPATQAQNVLSDEAIRDQLSPVKEKAKAHFNSLGVINLNGKVDKDGKATADAIEFEIPVPASFKEQVPSILEDFFLTSKLPVNAENMKTALGVVNAEMFNAHGVEIIQMAVNHAITKHEEKIRAEYENNNGLLGNQTHQPTNTNDFSDDFLKDYVRGY